MHSMILEADLAGIMWLLPMLGQLREIGQNWDCCILHNGNWNGEQLFSKDWVAYATTPTPTSEGRLMEHNFG